MTKKLNIILPKFIYLGGKEWRETVKFCQLLDKVREYLYWQFTVSKKNTRQEVCVHLTYKPDP